MGNMLIFEVSFFGDQNCINLTCVIGKDLSCIIIKVAVKMRVNTSCSGSDLHSGFSAVVEKVGPDLRKILIPH